MIDLSLTDEQKMLQDTIRGVVSAEIAPIIDEYEDRQEFPIHVLARLGQLGLLSLGFPEDVGGAGGHLEVAMFTEELAAIAGGACSSIMTHCIGAKMISEFGSHDQRTRFLPKALDGSLATAIAITEPEHGSDIAGIETAATRDRLGWHIRGQKMFITNASFAGAFIVMATTDRSRGKDGISMFVVERDSPGLQVGSPLRKLGWHTSDTCPVFFEDVEAGHDALLGTEGEGFSQLAQGFVFERVIMGAMGVGAARTALNDAMAYARERRQFGKRIGEFQVIKHQLADLATRLEAARLLVYRAAWLADLKPADPAPAAMAKLYATETACRVAERAVQIFGGMGFMEGVRVARIYRDVKVLTIGGGTSEIMRGIVARSLGL